MKNNVPVASAQPFSLNGTMTRRGLMTLFSATAAMAALQPLQAFAQDATARKLPTTSPPSKP